MRPKKNAAKTIQKPIITIELGLGSWKSNAPGRKRMANMPTTSTGEASRIASVKRVAHECLERPSCENTPLREPVRDRPLLHVGATGVGRRRRRWSVSAAYVWFVRIGEAAVELPNRVDLEVLERFVDGPDEADSPTSREEHDAIAQRQVRNRVRGEHDGRGSVGQLPHVADELRAGGRVETGRRLVQEQHAGFGEQLDGNAGPLALPSAQRADPNVGLLGQPDRFDRGTNRVIDVGRGRSTTAVGAVLRSGACVEAAGRRG